ncbi:hypothetical protein [Pseudomonas matsuisoli]|uniref:PsiF repeat-containing protein n=1 Tax=Pseudomonas matsuisoli TaxID=1515666 RepID=A0A917USV8_9PSED|nr:hypothetical protein [Pseudomonas matsuisoli]GGJ82965.1 hypothetical protein GCM10009304_06270 [Pseudomonas matsuisoli]
MRYLKLITAGAALAFTLPAAADWTPQARSAFVQQCVAGAQGSHGQGQLQAYCECAAEKVSAEFTEEEIKNMGSQGASDPAVRQRLMNASSSCNANLKR